MSWNLQQIGRSYQPGFDSDLLDRSRDYAGSDDRMLFYYLINIEHHPAVLPVAYKRLQDELAKASANPEERFSTSSSAIPEDWLNDAMEETRDIKAVTPGECKDVLRQYAPTALVEACWLQATSQAAMCHTEYAADLLRIFAYFTGDGRSIRHMGNRYCSLLNFLEIDMPKVTTRMFAEQSGVMDRAFESPVIQLSLAQFPRCFLPEILGYTLAHAYGLSRFFRLVSSEAFETLRLPPAYLSLHLNGKEIYALRELAKKVVKTFLDPYEDSAESVRQWPRVRSGFILYLDTDRRIFEAVNHAIAHPLTLRARVLALFSEKASYGIGHHRTVSIGGRSLDDWLGTIEKNGEAFLKTLVESGYFSLDNPAQSRFMSEINSFDGPMFGVFDSTELELIDHWLRSETEAVLISKRTNLNSSSMMRRPEREKTQITRALKTKQAKTVAKKFGVRELYYALVNVDLFPLALAPAELFVTRTLKRSSARMHRKTPRTLRFFEYSTEAFQQWITEIYRKEMAAYKPFVAPPKLDKACYEWAIEQFAPFILVDGCWLQNIHRAGKNLDDVNGRLFTIFADEVGIGHTQWNHPNVYRRLLASLDIDLPDFSTEDFARHPGFLEPAFDLPVFLLAISQFPAGYLPEILGLNLAIELSGLGAVYMRLADELDYWGIDSKIIKLHLSIDNLAGGHSAIARDAIGLYLDEQLSAHGDREMQRQWRRIWRGYLALQHVLKRFKYVLIWTFVKRFAIPRCYRSLRHRLSTDREEVG